MSRVRYIFGRPGAAESLILGTISLLGGIGVNMWLDQVHWLPMTFVGAGLLAWAVIVITGLTGYKAGMARMQSAAVAKWVRSGDSPEEVKRRRDTWASMGTAGVVAAGLATNLDGIPMIDGTMVDIMGRTFGDISDPMADFSSDIGDGMTIDVSDSYSSPMGMDSSSGGFGHG